MNHNNQWLKKKKPNQVKSLPMLLNIIISKSGTLLYLSKKKTQ